jgi:hypothetical protein
MARIYTKGSIMVGKQPVDPHIQPALISEFKGVTKASGQSFQKDGEPFFVAIKAGRQLKENRT